MHVTLRSMERSVESTILGRMQMAEDRRRFFFFVSITISTRCPILLRSSLNFICQYSEIRPSSSPTAPYSFALFPSKIFPPLGGRWKRKRRALWRIPGSSYFSIIRNLYGGIGLTVEIDTTVSVHVHFLDHILDWNTERKAAYVLCLVAPFENYRREGGRGKSSEQDVNEYIKFSIFFFFRRKKEIVILLCFLTSLRN